MKRGQLEHVARAAGSIVGVDRILVIGSQSILGSYDEDHLPPEVTVSNEADIAFFDDPDGDRAALLDGSIGEASPLRTGLRVLRPGRVHDDGRAARRLARPTCATAQLQHRRVTAWCLDIHDLWVAKLAAGRSNDVAFCEALLRDGLVDVATLQERLASTNLVAARRALAEGLIQRTGRRAP